MAFSSVTTNLVGNDTNGFEDIFIRDLKRKRTRRISVRSGGAQTDNSSFLPSISADGLSVVFRSGATNLVSNDTNN